MTREEFVNHLMKHKPCQEALDWFAMHPEYDHAATVQNGQYGWVIWWADVAGVDRTKFVDLAKDVAALVGVQEPADHPGGGVDSVEYRKKIVAAYWTSTIKTPRHVSDVITNVLHIDPTLMSAVSNLLKIHLSVEDIEAALTTKEK